jgi:serine/threonine-protein kinase
MVRLLSVHKPAGLGICVLYTQPDQSSGLQVMQELQTQIADPQWSGEKRTTRIVETMLAEAAGRLDHDAELTGAVRRARNVVLPIRFTDETTGAMEDGKLPGLLVVHSLNVQALPFGAGSIPPSVASALGNGPQVPTSASGVRCTFDDLAAKAGALGHLNLTEDPDGIVRRIPLLVQYQGRLFPSLALQLALKHIGSQLAELTIQLDLFGQPQLHVQHLQMVLDGGYHMPLQVDRDWTHSRTYSFVDVLDGTIDPARFKDQIVLIGATAEEIGPSYRLGGHERAAAVEVTANLLARILSPVRLSGPSWARVLEIAALLYFAFFLLFVIPRVQGKVGAAILAVFLLTWYALVVALLLGYGYRLALFGPVWLACGGFALLRFTHYSRETGRERMEANKALGLAYQGQGMLDMAYEKYMQCPVRDESVKNLLYNLALDFERKRMLNKALAIYQHIRTGGAFKDVDKRSSRLKPLDSTMALGIVAGRSETPLLMDDTHAKPTFGRYEILRELGRGAMGTVFLGRDPKIHREVAIKTLEYAQVAPGELAEVKARFFREAEAAGRLSHPSIVAVHDVGEEHDMAYIAMERLDGEELTHYCKPDHLLPIPRVLTIIAEVTAALDYAHRQGVIHRDIKPANIMLLAEGRVKVTDFGIAHVVDASQTRTGVILGTPNYMSPEQVAGENLDGRSDLFSLGIVLYELLCGAKPFKGDTITAILHAINHTPPAPLTEFNPEIPTCCQALVKKLLAKKAAQRFDSAETLARAIDSCLAEQAAGAKAGRRPKSRNNPVSKGEE